MSMPVNKSDFEVTAGCPDYWTRATDSGRVVKCAFCADCGTRLYHLPMRNQAIVNIKPGCLTETRWLYPVGHLWLSSAQSEVSIPDGMLCFDKQPDDFEVLYQAWLGKLGSGNPD